jgi:hypothetical protein
MGVACQVSNGYCSCDSISSPGMSACPDALIPVCCASASSCSCSYGGTCSGTEHRVANCRASELQPPAPQCPMLQTLVTSCH